MTKTRHFLKVKIFSSQYPSTLEELVNDFLRSINPGDLNDIKYSTSDKWSECMVIYHASEEEEA